MRAHFVEFSSVGEVRVGEERVSPEDLGALEVLVRNEASIVSAGTELSRLHGIEAGATFPTRPGYASVGRILARGAQVRDFEIGARVFYAGKHVSLQRFTHGADHQWGRLYPAPNDLAPHIAVFAGLAQIALTAPLVARVDLGDTVAVFGLGLVGNLAAQLFQLRGARVLCLDPVANRRELARACGLQVLEAGAGQAEDQIEAVREATKGLGAHVCVDAVGHSKVIENCVQSTALFGQVVLLGTPRAAFQTDATPAWNAIHDRGLTVRGAHMWRFPAAAVREVKHTVASNFASVFDLLRSHQLKVEPLLSHFVGGDRAPEIYEGLKNRPEKYWGAVFDWSGS